MNMVTLEGPSTYVMLRLQQKKLQAPDNSWTKHTTNAILPLFFKAFFAVHGQTVLGLASTYF